MARKKKFDFTGVESYTKAAEGQHVAVLKGIEEKQSQAGNDMLSALFEVTVGNSKGARVYDNFVLAENSMWKLKSFLEAVGVKANGRIVLDLDQLVGKVCIIEVSHEEYNGSTRARIQEYRKVEELEVEDDDDEDDEDIEPVVKKKTKKKPAPAKKKPVDDDEDDEDDDEDWDE